MLTFDDAENLFYGDFDFSNPSGFPGFLRVTHRSTPAFRLWGFRRLIWPVHPTSNQLLSKRSGEGDAEFMQAVASNYLLKNFWHNYVHHVVQGINATNYHAFQGAARYESDFVADNLATLLLAAAYGITVLTKGQSDERRRVAVDDLLQRNRCNLLFAERDKNRELKTAELPGDKRWGEAEWLFRRRVAVTTSNELLRLGAASADVGVYLPGVPIPKGTWYFRDQNVVLRINGFYLRTPFVPYIPDPAEELSQVRANSARRRPKEIADSAVAAYIALLKSQRTIRANAEENLHALEIRLGVPLLGS